ncbi:hypothetical protein ACV6K4_000099 [Acinetobacter baumannii]|nr:hypothetical protein [Acinetobacter baumannii]EKU6362232.1 hypothetical protein [Acinetobacter baumannii]EKV5731285.1 hypothetical protein [Acinetobacter baumannii]EKW7561018.1 hypothetical protein [Acinetobacter baumannii]EKX2283768.1 hypothetical protein [Acinetobacter baumannii]
MVTTENRTKMVGCHMTEREKKFLRLHAASLDDTISTFVRKALTDVLSKVESPDNPFREIKNKQ